MCPPRAAGIRASRDAMRELPNVKKLRPWSAFPAPRILPRMTPGIGKDNSEPLAAFLRNVPPDQHVAALENVRWYVGFVRRLAARLQREAREGALDNEEDREQR